MNLAAGSPQHWLVTMADGSVVDIWADSVEGLSGPEDQRNYAFSNLMDIAPADQCAFHITATTPANPTRVAVLSSSRHGLSITKTFRAPVRGMRECSWR